MENVIETLAKKAGAAEDSVKALQFSQAAANVAHALCALRSVSETR